MQSSHLNPQCVLDRARGSSRSIPCRFKSRRFAAMELASQKQVVLVWLLQFWIGKASVIRSALSMRIRLPDRLNSWWQRKHDWRERRWAAVARQQGTFVTKLQPNLRIRLYGDSELCRLIYCRNFEVAEREFVNRFLRPGDVFVDVGANIGLFTLIAASRVGPTGRVIAFEPSLGNI